MHDGEGRSFNPEIKKATAVGFFGGVAAAAIGLPHPEAIGAAMGGMEFINNEVKSRKHKRTK